MNQNFSSQPIFLNTLFSTARKIVCAALFFIAPLSQSQTSEPPVLTGLDVLIRDDFAPLKGKKVGLITNPTGIAINGDSTVTAMRRSKNVNLIALYGPEHGVYGDQIAGAYVPSITDPRTGLKAWSLYGPNRKPTREMLNGIDILVYDIQDIGCRSYTYISTLGLAMEAAGETGIEFMVLDRPNPLGGNRIEGPGLDPKFKSFVGQWPVPYVYGLTPGEIAKMVAGESWIKTKPKLTIIPMEGWNRSMTWEETKLRWIPTSPHIPRGDTSYFYVVTGWIGESGTVSNGVGYPQPFELIGLPNLNAEKFAANLNALHLKGVWFRPAYYKSFYTPFKDKVCGGVQIHLTDVKSANLSAVGIHMMKQLIAMTGRNFLDEAKPDGIQMFDKVSGSDRLRKALYADKPADEIIREWQPFLDSFARARAPYLLYP